MKNKKCPNCLCDINLDAIICPFCKTQIKSQMKFLPTIGFKPPEVVAQDVKPLHNTKVNIEDIELPQFLKKDESDYIENNNQNFENNYLEVEEKKETIPYTPKILNIEDLPQNDNLFIEPEEEKIEPVKQNSEFDFNGELMQEIKAYFEMPSPNSQDFEKKHLDIIESMSIDDIIKGSLDTHKKEHQQESFGLMFGQEEKQQEELPSYKEINKNPLESSEKVKKIYDKISEQRDYNSYMYDTLDTSLDALGFVDEKVDFGELKKKLDEPEPSIHNIVEHIPFKIPKLPLKKESNEHDKNISINDEFNQDKNRESNNSEFNFKEHHDSERIELPSFINNFESKKLNEEFLETPEFINNIDITESLEQVDIQEIQPPDFINSFGVNAQVIQEDSQDNKDYTIEKIKTTFFIDKILEIKEDKQIIHLEEVDKLLGLLQIRGKTLSQEIDKTDPYHREPFEIDNLEIVEVKDYFKEEIIEEIVKASEINVDIDSLKELIDFAGVQEEPEEEMKLSSQEKDNEDISKNIPKFQAKNILRVSDEKIEEKKGEMTPTRIVRDAISELENLKNEFLSEDKNDEIQQTEENDIKAEINTDLSSWFDTKEISKESNFSKEVHIEENKGSLFDLADLNNIQLELDKSKDSNLENLEPLVINKDEYKETIDEISIPSFINESLETLEPISNTKKDDKDSLNIEIKENILNFSNDINILDSSNNDIGNVFIENNLDLEKISIPENILNLSNDIKVNNNENIDISVLNQSKEIKEGFEDEIKVPEFLNNISIESPKIENILNETLLQENIIDSNIESLNTNINQNDIQEINTIEELEVPEPPKFVIPPPPPPIEEVKIRVPPPPPPQDIKKTIIPPPPPIENKQISPIVEDKSEFSIPTFDTSLTNNPPKIRSPITTTLNTTLGARSTTNQEAMDLYIYARDLCLKKEYSQALDILEKSVRIDPAFEQAHILLSRTYLKLKNVY